jgi:GAF domain-containing protein
VRAAKRPRSSAAAAATATALLAEATRVLGGTLDLGRLMSRLSELAATRLTADAAGVWLFEHRDSELVLRGDLGFKRPEIVARLAHPPGRDVLGWITDRPGPLLLRELPATARPEAHRWLEDEEVRSFLGVPLLGDAVPLGALALFRRGRRPFTRRDLAHAETMCVPAVPAILNARLYAEQLGRAERTEILLATAEALGATLDLPAALADLSQRAARAMDAERCTITLWPGRAVPADAPPAEAEVARTKRPVEVDDSLLVRIVRKGEAIGVLRLTARGRRRWERSAGELASAIAGQIALVAENARLYREAQTQAGELAALREVGTTLTSTLDLTTVLDAVMDAAVRLSGAQQCAVLQLDPADQRLYVRAQRGFDVSRPSVSLALGQGAAGVAAQNRAPFFVADLGREALPMDDVDAGRPGLPLRQIAQRRRAAGRAGGAARQQGHGAGRHQRVLAGAARVRRARGPTVDGPGPAGRGGDDPGAAARRVAAARRGAGRAAAGRAYHAGWARHQDHPPEHRPRGGRHRGHPARQPAAGGARDGDAAPGGDGRLPGAARLRAAAAGELFRSGGDDRAAGVRRRRPERRQQRARPA